MPTKKQLSQSMESQFEFPQTRREDDPAYIPPNPSNNSVKEEQGSEMIKIIKELACDFAWENKLDVTNGYQSFRKAFDVWFTNSEYHKNKLTPESDLADSTQPPGQDAEAEAEKYWKQVGANPAIELELIQAFIAGWRAKEGDAAWTQSLEDLWRDVDLITDHADFDEVKKYKMIKEKINSFNKTVKP